ncbi:MAG TPA: ClpXP adapter SpxH family protein [Saprospiraceae bacterium]|nr:ClpXP adapter SpxH family protein [Saprospiraceae bacterium]
MSDHNNPLLCDPFDGICTTPGAQAGSSPFISAQKPVRIVYFTDPICSSCWGIEPQLRRLKLEYGDAIDIEYHMGGLLPSWEVYNSGGISKPSDVAHHWDEVSAHYQMPIDGDVWLEDPLPSSYPPSIAFKAAQMQDEHKALLFLRRIREMVFLEKKNITRWEHLQQAALETGLDPGQLKKDYDGAAQQRFQDDLALARSLSVRGFPTLFFTDSAQNRLVLYGVRPYEQFEQTLLTLYPAAQKKTYGHSPEQLFRYYPTLTTREYAVLADTGMKEAEMVLTQLLNNGQISRFSSKNGPLWKWAGK